MEVIIPWNEFCEAFEPFYPNPKGAGRRPIGIERMLRIYFLQHWFSLSAHSAEEILYDSRAMWQFVGIDLGEDRHMMKQPSANSTIWWKDIIWATDCSIWLISICRETAWK